MEVHHHPHVEKKGFKEYFLEFLMIFLAVTLGFFAESLREDIANRHREKQYIESMVNDLKTDSTGIQNVIKYNKRQVSGFDSLLQNIYHKPYTDSSLRTLYYLKETYTLVRGLMIFSNGTISQLKYSGGLRLIRDKVVSDSIINYDMLTTWVEGQGDGVDYSGKKLLDLSVKIFDGENVLDYNSSSNYRKILSSNKKFNLLTNDEKIIKEYANLAKFKKDVIINYIRQLTILQSRIPGIIQFLEKEYHM